MFAVRTVRDGGVATVEVTGAVDIGSFKQFGDEIDLALSDRIHTLVVDLVNVTYIDSHGFAVLVGVRNELADTDVRLIMGPRPEWVRRLFGLMALTGSFEFDPPLN